MWTGARRTISIILALAIGPVITAQAATQPHPRTTVAHPRAARSAPAHAPVAHAPVAHGPVAHAPVAHGPAAHANLPKFRPSRGAAAADAKRLGAMIGKECTGRADMPRNEHEWVVLCSNGKTYVVAPAAAHQPTTPAVECSLAGTGPEPACFP
jgi:hypothetical protein